MRPPVRPPSRSSTFTSGLPSDFDAFLHSCVWEDKSGMPLSILSALARLDVDPWDEADTLAHLPKDTALRRLTSLLGRLPGRPAHEPELETICRRSASLLPHRDERTGATVRAPRIPRERLVTIAALSFFLGVLCILSLIQLQAPRPANGDVHPSRPNAAIGKTPTLSRPLR